MERFDLDLKNKNIEFCFLISKGSEQRNEVKNVSRAAEIKIDLFFSRKSGFLPTSILVYFAIHHSSSSLASEKEKPCAVGFARFSVLKPQLKPGLGCGPAVKTVMDLGSACVRP